MMRFRHLKISGIVMRPCSMTVEENEKVMMGSKYAVRNNFLESYNDKLAQLDITIECAKVFIDKNWKRVKDWSGLDVIVVDNTGKKTDYFNYKGREKSKSKSDVFEKILKRMDAQDKRRHNPIKTFKKVVLDPTDGDLSVTINGKHHLWVDDETVLIIADYIEKQLKNEESPVHSS